MIRCYPIVLLLVFLGLTAAPVLAQMPHGPQGPHDRPSPPPAKLLENFFQLSESQLADVRQLIESRHGALQPLQEQMMSTQKALQELVSSANPDPAAVGTLLLQTHRLQQQMAETQKRFVEAFEGLLTPDQRGRLQAVRQAARLQPVVGALQQLGFL